ncbi:hypothetical protein KEM48_005134 [Puccinia striiformis f. sp. tritici PST-130]|nr:hypothetical protein KEM48_005134 [Puccinia striiformis f. sp. tritici PST-130]
MLVAGAAEQVSWRLDYIQTQLTTTPSTSPTNANQTNRTETSRNAILPTPSKSVTRNMDQVKELSEVPQKFLKEGSQIKRNSSRSVGRSYRIRHHGIHRILCETDSYPYQWNSSRRSMNVPVHHADHDGLKTCEG